MRTVTIFEHEIVVRHVAAVGPALYMRPLDVYLLGGSVLHLGDGPLVTDVEMKREREKLLAAIKVTGQP